MVGEKNGKNIFVCVPRRYLLFIVFRLIKTSILVLFEIRTIILVNLETDRRKPLKLNLEKLVVGTASSKFNSFEGFCGPLAFVKA